jgi:Helix-turn-helix domain
MTTPAQPLPAGTVPYETDIALAAALIADPTRAAILRALLPDRPLAAGELARLAKSQGPERRRLARSG